MAKVLGERSFGRCYLTDDFRVLKIFIMAKFINKIDERLLGIKNDTYVFYDSFLKNEYEKLGIYERYIPGKSLDKQDISYDNLIKSIDKVYSDTDALSYQNIETYDVLPRNMIYYNGIKIIDTDFYNALSSDKLLRESNIQRFNQGVEALIIPNDETPKILLDNKSLNELWLQTMESLDDNRTLKEFLICLRNECMKNKNEKIDTAWGMYRTLSR